MIVLPSRPDRAWSRSFGLAAAVLLGLLLGAAAGLSTGLLAASLLAATAAFRPRSFRVPYLFYNRVARRFARPARAWVLAICFHTVFLVAGRAGSTLAVRRPEAASSLWLPRATLVPRAYASPFADAQGVTRQRWPLSFVWWAVRSGNPWAIGVLPFLMLLRTLDPEPSLDFRGDIYTLY